MFYGCEHSDLKPTSGEFAFVGSLGGLYRLLLGCWRRETCAPRLQDKWSESNPTCGQCSITAFLVQDIFGGEVYGVPNGDGSFHCFNKVGDAVFDLTSEQFDHPIEYRLDIPPETRDTLRQGGEEVALRCAEGSAHQNGGVAMSRTLTDFSQLSKGMLRKSAPVVEALSRAEARG